MNDHELSAPEFKYTDRQVREDPELRYLAEAYVRIYGGSFEPVVAAKQEERRTGRLETRTARVVLNCMRYDQNVASQMPVPQPPKLELVKEKKSKGACEDTRPHYMHGEMIGRKYITCEGVPWPINRAQFDTKVNVKAPWASARNGAVYHLTTGVGYRCWNPPAHKMGAAQPRELLVKVKCKYPSILRNPLLFMEEPTTLMSTNHLKPGYRPLCHWCVEARDEV